MFVCFCENDYFFSPPVALKGSNGPLFDEVLYREIKEYVNYAGIMPMNWIGSTDRKTVEIIYQVERYSSCVWLTSRKSSRGASSAWHLTEGIINFFLNEPFVL